MKYLGFAFHNKTEQLILGGYNNPGLSWARKTIANEKKVVHKTAKESNNLGLYKVGNSLRLNGSDIATLNNEDNGFGVVSNNETIKTDNTVLFSGNACINITLQNYIDLRSGKEVVGYARYNSKQVYNIVDDVNTAPVVHYANPYDIEDFLYNNIEGFQENGLSNNDFLQPYGTPTLVLKHVNAKIKVGEPLVLDYFVDTKDYASVYQGIIGDTFTVIVTTATGEVIYNHTTYAGRFIGKTTTFDTAGETWIKIVCIDKAGRRSVEQFYDVLVLPDTNDNIYNVTSRNLLSFGITPGDNVTYAQAHNNVKGFAELCWWAKSNGYTGIRMYNENSIVGRMNLDDGHNTKYIFDQRYNIGTEETPVPAGNVYFLIKTVGGVIQGLGDYNPQEDTDISVSEDDLVVNCNLETLLDKFEPLRIQENKEFEVDGVTRIVDESDPFDWIRKDGAHIYREDIAGSNYDKVRTIWWDVDSGEVSALGASYASKPYLKVVSLYGLLKDIKAGTPSKSLRRGTTNGDGYYYAAFYTGPISCYQVKGNTAVHTYGDRPPLLPNNFTIDLNYTTIEQTANIDYDNFAALFRLSGNINTNVKNGKLIGAYSIASIKDAFLKQCKHGSAVWEAAGPLLSLNGAKHCTIDNVKLVGSHGYELVLADRSMAVFTTTFSEPSRDILFNNNYTLGFIDHSNTYVNDCLIRDNNHSLVGIINTTYDYNGQTNKPAFWTVNPYIDSTKQNDICIITSPEISVANMDAMYGNITNEDKNPSKVAHINSFHCISAGSSSSAITYGGSYVYSFITFYDIKHNFISNIKVSINTPFKIPANASFAKISTYSVCKYENGRYSVYEPLYEVAKDTYKNRAMFLQKFKLFTNNCAQNIVVKNCVITDTRTCAITDPGVNNIFVDTTFERICSTDHGFDLTPMLCDSEENRCRFNNISFIRCIETRRSPRANYQNDQTSIKTFVRGITMEDCVGLSLQGMFPDANIRNCLMGLFNVTYNGGEHPTYYMRINGLKVVVTSVESYSEGDRIISSYPRIETSKSCWEPVSNKMPMEDSFLVNQSPTSPIYDKDSDTEYNRADKALRRSTFLQFVGRAFKVGTVITENYSKLED